MATFASRCWLHRGRGRARSPERGRLERPNLDSADATSWRARRREILQLQEGAPEVRLQARFLAVNDIKKDGYAPVPTDGKTIKINDTTS